MERGGCVYIMTNKYHTTLYIGVTSDLFSRVTEHKNKLYPNSFTAKYNCGKLVFYKQYPQIEEAIGWEKRLKNWKRDWKINLINNYNPEWRDLINNI